MDDMAAHTQHSWWDSPTKLIAIDEWTESDKAMVKGMHGAIAMHLRLIFHCFSTDY